jgi:hypothetical protein
MPGAHVWQDSVRKSRWVISHDKTVALMKCDIATVAPEIRKNDADCLKYPKAQSCAMLYTRLTGYSPDRIAKRYICHTVWPRSLEEAIPKQPPEALRLIESSCDDALSCDKRQLLMVSHNHLLHLVAGTLPPQSGAGSQAVKVASLRRKLDMGIPLGFLGYHDDLDT